MQMYTLNHNNNKFSDLSVKRNNYLCNYKKKGLYKHLSHILAEFFQENVVKGQALYINIADIFKTPETLEFCSKNDNFLTNPNYEFIAVEKNHITRLFKLFQLLRTFNVEDCFYRLIIKIMILQILFLCASIKQIILQTTDNDYVAFDIVVNSNIFFASEKECFSFCEQIALKSIEFNIKNINLVKINNYYKINTDLFDSKMFSKFFEACFFLYMKSLLERKCCIFNLLRSGPKNGKNLVTNLYSINVYNNETKIIMVDHDIYVFDNMSHIFIEDKFQMSEYFILNIFSFISKETENHNIEIKACKIDFVSHFFDHLIQYKNLRSGVDTEELVDKALFQYVFEIVKLQNLTDYIKPILNVHIANSTKEEEALTSKNHNNSKSLKNSVVIFIIDKNIKNLTDKYATAQESLPAIIEAMLINNYFFKFKELSDLISKLIFTCAKLFFLNLHNIIQMSSDDFITLYKNANEHCLRTFLLDNNIIDMEAANTNANIVIKDSLLRIDDDTLYIIFKDIKNECKILLKSFQSKMRDFTKVFKNFNKKQKKITYYGVQNNSKKKKQPDKNEIDRSKMTIDSSWVKLTKIKKLDVKYDERGCVIKKSFNTLTSNSDEVNDALEQNLIIGNSEKTIQVTKSNAFTSTTKMLSNENLQNDLFQDIKIENDLPFNESSIINTNDEKNSAETNKNETLVNETQFKVIVKKKFSRRNRDNFKDTRLDGHGIEISNSMLSKTILDKNIENNQEGYDFESNSNDKLKDKNVIDDSNTMAADKEARKYIYIKNGQTITGKILNTELQGLTNRFKNGMKKSTQNNLCLQSKKCSTLNTETVAPNDFSPKTYATDKKIINMQNLNYSDAIKYGKFSILEEDEIKTNKLPFDEKFTPETLANIETIENSIIKRPLKLLSDASNSENLTETLSEIDNSPKHRKNHIEKSVVLNLATENMTIYSNGILQLLDKNHDKNSLIDISKKPENMKSIKCDPSCDNNEYLDKAEVLKDSNRINVNENDIVENDKSVNAANLPIVLNENINVETEVPAAFIKLPNKNLFNLKEENESIIVFENVNAPLSSFLPTIANDKNDNKKCNKTNVNDQKLYKNQLSSSNTQKKFNGSQNHKLLYKRKRNNYCGGHGYNNSHFIANTNFNKNLYQRHYNDQNNLHVEAPHYDYCKNHSYAAYGPGNCMYGNQTNTNVQFDQEFSYVYANNNINYNNINNGFNRSNLEHSFVNQLPLTPNNIYSANNDYYPAIQIALPYSNYTMTINNAILISFIPNQN
ncbi:hypothetical protein COBT_000949 [Conglomerata obtusa]